jgi:23S rRNA (guanosine2251-2'-O)-methyltransferase
MTERKKIFIFGINPVLEKLRHAPREIYEIMVSEGTSHPVLRSIVAEARRLGLPIRAVENSLLGRISGSTKHQGVVAEIAEYAYQSFGDMLRNLAHAERRTWILALDGVTDPRNFGALLRTAEAAGLQHIVIPTDRAVGVTPLVAKSSVGAVNYLKISRVTNLRRALLTLREHGFWIVGLDTRAKQLIYGQDYPEKLVIVLGSEGSGIRPLIRRECDLLVAVPMRGRIGSLNVGVAAGVFLYELVRQEAATDTGHAARGKTGPDELSE